MAYLGRPASPDVSVTGSTDTFTGNGGTTFTLSRPVKDSNASLLEVFVSNVQQQPSVTYSVASTTLTFVTAPGVGEPIYVTYRDYNVAPVFTVPDGAISEGKIQPDAVTESKIDTGAVTETKIDTGAVTETKIGTGAVVEGKLAANAVTEAKIADEAITSAKIAANAVTEAKFANGSITELKLAANAITSSKISSNVTIQFAAGSNTAPSISVDGDSNTGIFFPAADTIAFTRNGVEVGRFDSDANANLQFNSGYGSVATAYGCRAWVNFNGNTTPSVRASGGVSSVARTASPEVHYTVNLTNSMPDANYSVVGTVSKNATGDTDRNGVSMQLRGTTPLTTSSFTVCASATGVSPENRIFFCIGVFR